MNNTPTLVLPKKGRLAAAFGTVLDRAGLVLERAGPRADYGRLLDRRGVLPPMEALIQRPVDALRTLADGVGDAAIAGTDVLEEFRAAARNRGGVPRLRVVAGFRNIVTSRLSFAAPLRTERNVGAPFRIATSYPETLRAWLGCKGLFDVAVVPREGGVEDLVRLGLADAVLDIVQTGQSLRENGLEEKEMLLPVYAALIRPYGVTTTPEKERHLCALRNRLCGAAASLAH